MPGATAEIEEPLRAVECEAGDDVPEEGVGVTGAIARVVGCRRAKEIGRFGWWCRQCSIVSAKAACALPNDEYRWLIPGGYEQTHIPATGVVRVVWGGMVGDSLGFMPAVYREVFPEAHAIPAIRHM